MKSFLSLLSERREMRASKNAVLGLGVGWNPGPLAPELCVLPCALLQLLRQEKTIREKTIQF
jgi:hypothetical protein